MINSDDLKFLSSNLPFWDHLTKEQKATIEGNSNANHFTKNQLIHFGDNQCVGVLFIKKGTLRVYITSEEGREVTLYRLEENDVCILSASCVLENIYFDVSVDAATDCEVLQLSSAMFSALARENVYVELFAYKLTTTRFSDVMWAMQEILFSSFDKRLAGFLIDEALKSKDSTIHMTHEEIAKNLGSAREVVSRMLKYFTKEGYGSLSRGGVTILDNEGLRKLI